MLNPSKLDIPSYVMCAPFSYSTTIANNEWMNELSKDKRKIDLNKAMKQFLDLYCYMSSEAFVQNLPTPEDCNLQDLTFVASLGFIPEHFMDRNIVILPNFTAKEEKKKQI